MGTRNCPRRLGLEAQTCGWPPPQASQPPFQWLPRPAVAAPPTKALAQDERLRGGGGGWEGRGCEVGSGQMAELPLGHADCKAELGSVGSLGPWTPTEETRTSGESHSPPAHNQYQGWGGRLQAGVARQHLMVPQPWLDHQLGPCGRVETHGSPPQASVSPSVK